MLRGDAVPSCHPSRGQPDGFLSFNRTLTSSPRLSALAPRLPSMLLTVTYPVLPKRNSVRASLVMDHFGISPDSTEHVLARDLEVPLQPGDVVLFTGASGSGKSSLLKAVLRQLEVASQSTEEVSPRRHGGTEKNRAEAFASQPQPTDSPPELSPTKDSPSVSPCLRVSVPPW